LKKTYRQEGGGIMMKRMKNVQRWRRKDIEGHVTYQGKWKVPINYSTADVVASKILKSWGERKP